MLRTLFLGLCLLGHAGVALAADQDEVWIFCYYYGMGDTGLHLAQSEDGVHFTPLNNGRPVMPAPQWPDQNKTRDPSMIYHAGKFRVVWTTGWFGNCFGYAESTDLIHWSEPVKAAPFPAALPPAEQPNNVWASQIAWDPVQKNYMINISSVIGLKDHQLAIREIASNKRMRIFLTRTVDFKTFTPPKLLLDPQFGSGCMEGMMVQEERPEGNRWTMFFKKMRAGGSICVATAPLDLSQPWAVNPKMIAGHGTQLQPQTMAEGPYAVKTAAGWNLYWARGDLYGFATSTDLLNWTDHTAELQVPPNSHHGSFFRAPRSAVGWLNQSAGGKPPLR